MPVSIIWGVGFLGLIMLVAAFVIRKDWVRVLTARELRHRAA